jgi:hypothetical protein
MSQCTTPELDCIAWFGSLSDEEQCEVLEQLRGMARDAGVTIATPPLTIVDIQAFVAEDALKSLARIQSQISLN